MDKAYAISTNTTNTVISQTCRLALLTVCVKTAGSSWVIDVRNKEGTPKSVYRMTAAVGTTQPVNTPHGILMTGGIDIVTSGTTPGTADIHLVILG